jgi:hypothetical protein
MKQPVSDTHNTEEPVVVIIGVVQAFREAHEDVI